MRTARKYGQRRMSRESRNKSYATINILWKKMRPELVDEDKDFNRAERLNWMANLLNLGQLKSTTNLSDAQIGLVIEEMRRLTGDTKKTSNFRKNNMVTTASANVVHLSATRISDEQKHTLRKLAQYIGWTNEYRDEWLTKRNYPINLSSMTFKKATALTNIFLNIAAAKDLKVEGKKTGRKEQSKYIPTIKKKLGIDQSK